MSGLSVESRNCTLESCVDIEPFDTFRPILWSLFFFVVVSKDDLFVIFWWAVFELITTLWYGPSDKEGAIDHTRRTRDHFSDFRSVYPWICNQIIATDLNTINVD